MDTLNSGFQRKLALVMAVLFLLTLVGLVYPALTNDSGWSGGWMALLNTLIISVPLLLIACLFYIDWKWLGAAPARAV